jgi:hypothetical protein
MSVYQLPKKLHPEFRYLDKAPSSNVEVDYTNQLSKGVLSYFLPYSNSFKDVGINQAYYPATTGGSNSTPTFNKRGRYLQLLTGHTVDIPEIIFAAGKGFSVTWLAGKTVATSTSGMVCGDSSGTRDFIWQNSSSNNTVIRRDNVSTTVGISGILNSDLVWRTLVVSPESGSTRIYFYTKELSTSSALVSNQSFKLNSITSGFTSLDYEGKFQGLIVHNRALTESEAFTLHRDPYQILKPKTPISYFVPSAAAGAFTLTADTGAYTVAGTANSLLLNALLGAGTGSYSYTGTAADLTTGYGLQADTGSYAYTGATNALLADLLLTSDTGTYSYSGTASALSKGSALTAGTGSYAYTGADVSLTFEAPGDFTLAANTGTYSVSGTNADLVAAFSLTSDTGVYSYTGTAVTLSTGVTLQADTGSYTYTGTAVTFTTTINLNAETGVYVYNGNNATLSASGQVWTVQTDSVTTWTTQTDSNTTWTIQ